MNYCKEFFKQGKKGCYHEVKQNYLFRSQSSLKFLVFVVTFLLMYLVL